MTADFQHMLHLFACGALGKVPDPTLQYDFQRIYDLSRKQQVATIVYLSVARLKKDSHIAIDDALYQKWKQQFLSMICLSTNRGQYISGLIKKLDHAGIRNCILKGEVLSSLYVEPDSRVSSDVDLWIIDSNQMNNAISIMRSDGFIIGDDNEKSHQIECTSREYGLVELHRDFCDSVAKKIWFKNIVQLDATELIDIPDRHGGVIHTLSCTNGAIHITLHFIKHFLSHGCGCRQLMDTLLYLERYKEDINWKQYEELLAELNFCTFIDVCKKIGTMYFELDFSKPTDQDKILCDAILSDMEGSGIYGTGEEYRKRFFYSLTNQKASSVPQKIIYAKHLCINAFRFIAQNKFDVRKMHRIVHSRKMNKELAQGIDDRLQLLKALEIL